MAKRRITLGIATAAALLLPLGFVSPAFAEEPATDEPTVGAEFEAPTATEEEAFEITEEDLEIVDEEVFVDEEEEAAAEETEQVEEAPAVAGAEEVASAAAATFGNVKLTGPTKTTLEKSKTKTVKFSLKFDGPTAAGHSYYISNVTVKMVGKNKKLSSKYVWTPPYASSNTSYPTPTSGATITLPIQNYKTPGKYRVSVSLTHRVNNVNVTTVPLKRDITINANKSYSKSYTSFWGSARSGKTFKGEITAPAYQAGEGHRVLQGQGQEEVQEGQDRHAEGEERHLREGKGEDLEEAQDAPRRHGVHQGQEGLVRSRVQVEEVQVELNRLNRHALGPPGRVSTRRPFRV